MRYTPAEAARKEQEVQEKYRRGVDNSGGSGIINDRDQRPLNISMQFFAKRSEDFETVYLPKAEYAHVMSEIATNLTEEQASKRVFRTLIGDHAYLVENNGFGNYRIIGKEEIE